MDTFLQTFRWELLGAAVGGHAVGERVDLIEEMRDEEDGEAVVAELAEHGEKRGDFLLVETGGRLVEHEQLAFHIERAGDGDHLLERDGARLQRARNIEVEPQPRQRPTGLRAGRAPLDDAAAARQAAEHHVLREGERGDEIDLLKNGRDAAGLGVLRRSRMNLAPGELNRPAVALIHARDDLDQRGFARAILAEQRVDFSPPQLDLHAGQRLHAGERFRDLARGK